MMAETENDRIVPPQEIAYINIYFKQKKIIRRDANMTICAHGYMFTRPSRISASANYFSTAIVVAIPTLECYSSFEKFFLIFRKKIWFLTLGVYFFGMILLAILRFFNKDIVDFVLGKRNHSPFLNMFIITTGSSISRLPKRNFARYLFIVWTLSTMILRSSYQGSLFDSLQKNEARPTTLTLRSLLDSGHILYMPEDSMQWFADLPDIKTHIQTMNRSLGEYLEDMQSPNYKGIVLTTDTQIDYYNHAKGRKVKIKYLKERMFITPQSIFYPKHSFLVHHIDFIIHDCLAGGLISHWVKTFLHDSRPTSESTHKPLAFNDLQGFFSFIWGLNTFSMFVFLLEVLTKKVKCLMVIGGVLGKK